MEKYELDPGAFGLELTESVYVESQDTMAEAVARLQKKGFRFLMDDFGSGYSSLSVLKDCPMDVLKIDMTFVRDILESPRSQIILSEIIHMMHRLNLPMIAEGVEIPSRRNFLRTGTATRSRVTILPGPCQRKLSKNSSMRHRDKKIRHSRFF